MSTNLCRHKRDSLFQQQENRIEFHQFHIVDHRMDLL
jgi:hypothetical protein